MSASSSFDMLLPYSAVNDVQAALAALSGETVAPLGAEQQCLSLHFPIDEALSRFARESEALMPTPGQLHVGCIWTSLWRGERLALLRLTAATGSISRLFEESGSVQQTLRGLAQELGAVALFLDTEVAQLLQLWPGSATLDLPGRQLMSHGSYVAALLEAVSAQAPLRRFELAIAVTEEDRPEDKFSHHVNNARYAVFINRTLQRWYVPMGLRGALPDFSAMMARSEYDFLHEVAVPGEVVCLLQVSRVGRSSLEHRVEMWSSDAGSPRLVGRGRLVHVGIDRQTRKSRPWPPEVLALCWPGTATGASA